MKEKDKIRLLGLRNNGFLYLLESGFLVKSYYVYMSNSPFISSNVREADCKIIHPLKKWNLLKLNCHLIEVIRNIKIPRSFLNMFSDNRFQAIINCLNFAELNENFINDRGRTILSFTSFTEQVYHFYADGKHWIGEHAVINDDSVSITAHQFDFTSNKHTFFFNYPFIRQAIFYYWASFVILSVAPKSSEFSLFLGGLPANYREQLTNAGIIS